MRNNLRKPTRTLTIPAPVAVSQTELETYKNLVFLGDMILVAHEACTQGASATFSQGGSYFFEKEGAGSGQDFTAGDKVYWDVSEKRITKTALSNVLVGVAVEAVASTATQTLEVALREFTDIDT